MAIDPNRFIQLQNFKQVFKNGTRKNRFMLDFSYVNFALFQSEALAGFNQGDLAFLVDSATIPGKKVKSNERPFQGMITYFSADAEPPSGVKCVFLSDIDGKAYNFCEAWLNAKKNNLTNSYGAKSVIEHPLVLWQTDDEGEKIAACIFFGCVAEGSGDMDKAQGAGDFETFDFEWKCEFREVIRGRGTALTSAVQTLITTYGIVG
jgi:hypothetical protein